VRRALVALAVVLVLSSVTATGGERVYIGQAACLECHRDSHRDDFSVLYLARHAQAYPALERPESREIARLSGIDDDPVASPICLGCHATAADVEDWERDEAFSISDGVQCERCHGPGSEYSAAEIMADPEAARAAGLRIPTESDCLVCHKPKGSHDLVIGPSPFNFNGFPARAAKPQTVASHESNAHVPYKTPFNLVVDPEGQRLYIACEASDSVIVVDTSRREVVAEVAVGNLPHGVALSPDGAVLFVSNRGSDSVSVIRTDSLAVTASISVGDEPHGLVVDAEGRHLYVANAGSHDISVVDIAAGREVKRLAAGRGAWDVCLSDDGGSVLVTNNLSHFVGFRETLRSEVTVIETASAKVADRVMVPDANLVQGVDVAPDGSLALITLIRTKNLVPMTRVIQGWVLTNGLGVLWPDGRVDQLLLDEPDNYFADPTDVAITPDGRFAFVTGGGVDEVAVVDIQKMRLLLEVANDWDRQHLLPNHLGAPTEFVLTRIPVGANPRGIAVAPDGLSVYVADALDDTVSVIDVENLQRVAVIDLGGPSEITLVRRGERIFHSAEMTYGRQFSCHSCHPDGGVDGITYDIEPDGLGLNPVDNRSLRGVLDTAPFKWTGKNATLARQCGPRLAVFFTRVDPFTPDQVEALERYICTIPRNPNRHRALGARLTPAQRRGRALFERDVTNSGEAIPEGNRCITCHAPPYYTNREMAFVGEGSWLDTQAVFDIPHLTNIYETAPYMHDGRADTLEEIWTRFNPKDEHGVTNDMTKDQLNDLIEYLKTL
jgi:YVTN family beta-propeller protein